MNTPLHINTPVFESRPLSEKAGKKILLKMECFQPTGSFKIRGIGALCQELVAEGHDRLVCSSGGNAGYAVAYAARKLGVHATVIVPKTTHPVYLNRLKLEGAEVRVQGTVWDEANEAAMALVAQTQSGFIHPFDHPTIWAGHATMVDEIIEQCEKPDAIITAMGGGGLLCGVLEGLARHGWNDMRIFSVETTGAASFAQSVAQGSRVVLDKIDTIATSLGTKQVAEKIFDWSKKRPITPLVVSDHAAALACRYFADDHLVLVEPACGTALSVIYDQAFHPVFADLNSILIIVCGGVGISIDLLSQYLAKSNS